jgi:cytochrome c biogenesis protein
MEGGNSHEAALGFAIRCRDFKASFYPNGAPKDYVSTIDVIESGKVVAQKNIRVNDPLYYKGLRIYQSGYGQKGSFTFRIGDEEVVLAEQETLEKGNLVFKVVRFENEVHNFGPGVQIVYLEGDEPKTTWFLRNVERLRSQTIQGVNIQLVDISENPYTSLEVTSDPGVFVVWTGFALILFGLYVTFFTCGRRIFIVHTESGAIMAGFALKNKEMFKKEFEKLKEGVLGNVR